MITDEQKNDDIEALKAGYFYLIEERYPYTYHHDLVREYGYADSRAEAGEKLRKLEEKYGTKAALHALRFGALVYLIREQPYTFTIALGHDHFYEWYQQLETERIYLPRVPEEELCYVSPRAWREERAQPSG